MNLRQYVILDEIKKRIKNIEKEIEEIYELAEEIPETQHEENDF